MDKLRIGIVGAGYWGPNLIRNFSACPLTEVAVVCDTSRARLEAIGRTYGHLHLVDSLDRLLELSLDAVAIATPVSTHYSLASRCLEAGLHVLVEKPLTAAVWEAEALIDLAERHDRVLMVDHTYLYNNAVRRIKELVESGELGVLYYIDSIRINLGLFQNDINVVWDLAPTTCRSSIMCSAARPGASRPGAVPMPIATSRTSRTSTWTSASGCWRTSMSTGCRR